MPRHVDRAAVVVAIAAGLSDAEAAEVARCSARTVRRYRHDPTIIAELSTARAERLRRVADRLAQASDEAVTTLVAIAGDVKAPASARVRACLGVLDAAGTWRAATFDDERLRRLEALAEHRGLQLVRSDR